MTLPTGHPERPSRHPEPFASLEGRLRGGSAVHEALRALRAADEREAPAFDAVVARARRHRPMTWHPSRTALTAAVVLVVGSALLFTSARPEPLTVPAEVLTLSTWTPMTDVLLDTPNRGLLQETPRLDESLLPAVRPEQLPEPDSRLRW